MMGNMGKVNVADALGLSPGVFILLLTIAAAVVFFIVEKIQDKVTSKHDYEL